MTDIVSLQEMSKDELIDEVKYLNKRIHMQEDFLLNISHDLRSPVNVILSILQCLKYANTQDKEEEYNQIMKRNSYKIIKLIDNLIDTTKLENKFYNISKKNIDIVCIVENIVESVEKYSSYKNIQMVFDTNVEECIIGADSDAIDRIVMNLLSNAIKFSKSDSNIYVSIIKSKEYVSIEVKDTGMGIPKNEQKNIFDRFKQSSNNEKGEFQGSGIGLDLVNFLTTAHGGEVMLESEEGKGSTFIVKLPIDTVKIESEGLKSYKLNNKIEKLEIEFSDIYL